MADASAQEQRPTQPTQEVQVRTAVRTDVVANNPAQIQSADIAKQAIEALKQEAEKGEAGFTEEIPTDEQALKEIRTRFTGERDTRGELKDRTQRNLEKKTIKTDQLVRKAAREGFASITDAADQKIIIDQIDRVFDLQPTLNNLYPKGTPEREAFIRDFLSDTSNKDYYQILLTQEKKLIAGNASADEIQTLRSEASQKEEERAELVKEQKQLMLDLDAANVALSGFDADPTKGSAALVRVNDAIIRSEDQL